MRNCSILLKSVQISFFLLYSAFSLTVPLCYIVLPYDDRTADYKVRLFSYLIERGFFMSRFKTFYVNRARLAELLAINDIDIVPCPNIYRPDEPAWKCDLTPQAAEVIQEDYIARGKPVPGIVLDALAQ